MTMEQQSEATEGASYSEQILESARRNNTELLLQIKVDLNNDEFQLAQLINSTIEVITNNTPLHIACIFGNWEWIDIVLDIEGIEIDPRNKQNSTPLHLAVDYCNQEPEHGTFIVDNLLDAGANPSLKDNESRKPIDLIYIENVKLTQLLQSAEYAISMEIADHDQLNTMQSTKGIDNNLDDSSASDSDGDDNVA
jgi:ankyrin repeat protein